MEANTVLPQVEKGSVLESVFDAIYVINLPSRSDRRREMATQLSLIDAGLERGGVHLHEACRPADAGGFPSIGTHGCFLSHLGVLKRARAEQRKRILILEDDVDFAADFSHRAARLLADPAVRDASMLYLGFLQTRPPIEAPRQGWMDIDRAMGIVGAHMVSFDAEAIALAIPYLEAMLLRPVGDDEGGPMHVDGAYNWFRRNHSDLRTVLCIPPLGEQRPSRTDIHSLKWYDRWPLCRDVTAALRRVRSGRS
jgi:glycosyl transferase family 25